MAGYLGIDYGGTNTKLLLASDTGGRLTEVRREQRPTPRGRDPFGELVGEVRSFLGDDEVDAFGVTIAGVLDDRAERVQVSVNLPWLDGEFPALLLGEALGLPGAAVHDGAAAARAEGTLGAARGYDDMFMLALGTGVAGAHLVRGVLRRGAHGAASEIGHVATGEGRLCSCGQRGCLESSVGGAQLGARWDETLGHRPGTSSARDLVAAAQGGDARACRILDEATTALSRSLLGLMALVDPGIIVIGGGVGLAHDSVVQPAIDKARKGATFHRVPPMVPAELGRWAGAWGAVLSARDVTTPSAVETAEVG